MLHSWVVIPSENDLSSGKITAFVDYLTVFAVMAAENINIPYDINDHWAQSDILKLISIDAVHGYTDGSFRTENVITRAEFSKILVGAQRLSITTGDLFHFDDEKDIPYWAEAYIRTAVQEGYVQGFANGTFQPNATITREQAAVMMARVLGIKEDSKLEVNSFTDYGEISDWAKPGVNALVDMGIIEGYEDGSFRPQSTLTRAESAVMLLRLLMIQANNE